MVFGQSPQVRRYITAWSRPDEQPGLTFKPYGNQISPVIGSGSHSGTEIASHSDISGQGECSVGVPEKSAGDGGIEADVKEEPAGRNVA